MRPQLDIDHADPRSHANRRNRKFVDHANFRRDLRLFTSAADLCRGSAVRSLAQARPSKRVFDVSSFTISKDVSSETLTRKTSRVSLLCNLMQLAEATSYITYQRNECYLLAQLTTCYRRKIIPVPANICTLRYILRVLMLSASC